MSCSSRQRQRRVACVISWRTVTNTSAPVRPCLSVDARRCARLRVIGVADPQRRVKLQPAAGPHAPRQRHRRQEAAARADGRPGRARTAVQRQEVQPVPQRRQGRRAAARSSSRSVAAAPPRHRATSSRPLGAADPAAEMVDVQQWGHGAAPWLLGPGRKPLNLHGCSGGGRAPQAYPCDRLPPGRRRGRKRFLFQKTFIC